MAEEGTPVWEAEQELQLAQLCEQYDALNDQAHESPDDQALLDQRHEKAGEVVALRSELRKWREAQDAALSDGDGAAQPAPVEGATGVNE